MKEQDKYYTPQLEEFRVGFEYELQNIENAQWGTTKVYHAFGAFDDDIDALEEDRIRVKSLDREDIESEGFVNINNPSDINSEFKLKISDYEFCVLTLQDDCRVILEMWSQSKLVAKVLPLDCWDFYTAFIGTIKNISEFKILLKQIGIKK